MDTFALPIIAIVLLIIFVALITVILTMASTEKLPEARKDLIECPGLDEETCEQKNCIFKRVQGGPFCYMKKDAFGYVIASMDQQEDGPALNLTSNDVQTPYGEPIRNVNLKFTYITENILRFQFKDIDEDRYEVPVQKDFPLLQNPPTVNKDNLSYEVKLPKEGDVLDFYVVRKNGTIVWDSTIGGLTLSDQFLQIASYLPSRNIYGLGEHVHDTLRHNLSYTTWPIFARDRAVVSPSDNNNLYGVHPFYTCLENSGTSHGVLFLNSNAMEVTLLPAPAISFRTIGGILDFFIFVGDNPEHVIQLYTSLIGRPMLPPYWSLGFQLSRYGYNSLSELQKVMNRTREHQIPQAVQYLDIDYMKNRMDFTYDDQNFADLPDYVNKTKQEQFLKWIIILDPAIAVTDGYEPFESGKEKNIFIKKSRSWHPDMFPSEFEDMDAVLGKVWPPDYAAFPDFFQNTTKEWWKDNIKKHYETISFDGLWIDMNEPANFETNFEEPSFCNEEFKRSECKALFCPKSNFEDPPYNPLLKITGDRLSDKTLCMESVQVIDGKNHLHYDLHSLYGWSQSQPTLEAAQEATGTRSLVISRSTYPSSGRYAGHWLGDNFSTFEDMKNSIIGMLEFNMFGIPYIGADVCGFINDVSKALCKRWMQLGAFYPFFRSHNTIDAQPQDPAYFGKDVAESSRLAIERRIRLNPYLYTLFFRAHVDGSTVVRPLFYEFPEDEQTWDLGRQFMWGRSLLISPILEEKVHQSVFKYLPKGDWWLFKFEKTRQEMFTSRFVIETEADEYTPLNVRGGTVLPLGTYDWEKYPERDNEESREIDLYVFPEDGVAEGELFLDDGISIDSIENEQYALFAFRYEECKLEIISDEKSNFDGPKAFLNKVLIFKAKSVTRVSNNYEVTMDEELKIATVTVEAEMSTVLCGPDCAGLTWTDDENKCNMLP